MDAADLRIFQSVASTGSMSKAALELNTVQSNVTARIKSLEDEVGFALFERTNRGVTLTAAGELDAAHETPQPLARQSGWVRRLDRRGRCETAHHPI